MSSHNLAIGLEYRLEKEPAQRSVSFRIPGQISGKGRPRFGWRKGPTGKQIPLAYTPEKTLSEEALVRQFANAAMREQRLPMMAGPLEVTVHICRVPPKSWSKKQKAAKWMTGKPDIDNSLKLILDSMNGIVYHDDADVAVLIGHRTIGAENYIEINVTELT